MPLGNELHAKEVGVKGDGLGRVLDSQHGLGERKGGTAFRRDLALHELHPVAVVVERKRQPFHSPLIRLLLERRALCQELLGRLVDVVDGKRDVAEAVPLLVARVVSEVLVLLGPPVVFQAKAGQSVGRGFEEKAKERGGGGEDGREIERHLRVSSRVTLSVDQRCLWASLVPGVRE